METNAGIPSRSQIIIASINRFLSWIAPELFKIYRYFFKNQHVVVEYVLEVAIVIDFFWFKSILETHHVLSHKLSGGEVDTNWGDAVLWFIVTIILLLLHGTIKNTWRKRRIALEERLRFCLLNLRNISTNNAQKLYDITDAVNSKSNILNDNLNSPMHIQCGTKRYVHNLKQQILDMIYTQLTLGIVNLGTSYRVAIFEMDHDSIIRMKLFSNAEKSRPRVMSTGIGFKIKEGVAGWAWYYRSPLCVSKVKEYEKLIGSPQNTKITPMYIGIDDYTHSKIESIVCYPVVVRRAGCETVEALVSIDCDKEGTFDIKRTKDRNLRMTIYPYIRLLGWLYATVSYCKNVAGVDVTNCDCPLCRLGDD